MVRRLLTPLLLLTPLASFAQKDWHLKDPAADGIYGVNMTTAYEQVKGKQPKPVVVAVIDIGTDIKHNELRALAWTNPNEIPDNGIDDDKNGYVDDIHGWNFLGGKNGNIMYEATEETRMFKRLQAELPTKSNLPSGADKAELDKLMKQYVKAQAEREQYLKSAQRADKMNNKLIWQIMFRIMMGKGANQQINMAAEMAENDVLYNEINTDSLRRIIVGDNPLDPNERYYGNGDVIGPEASHGTHVAGIIASVFYNGDLPEDINSPLRIMVLRAVPWGDERDKDIANAIRYAVDNGATVINMSFGKNISPDKKVVDEAIAYAMAKDVLLVHNAGNDGENTDSIHSYPIRILNDGTVAGNWIEVGATGRKAGIASFSNYGLSAVDLFAPGLGIYSTMPHNKHAYQSGTSMASPVVAGVAAWLRSYFPYARATEIRKVLMGTVTQPPAPVVASGGKPIKTLKERSISGGIVNGGQAAAMMAKGK